MTADRAPAIDDWDRWNYDRTDQLLGANSERYVPPGMYGAYDLDRYGSWRVVPTYGRVWTPASVAPGWAPYSTGRWLYDPYYGWTWVDDAPWGWAPYHYGRWVYVDSYWAWAPGPIAVAVQPLYAPALVAFFTPDIGVSVGVGVPFVSWVALGWGEPLIPWWGPTFFVGHPWWGGWCGPHHEFHGEHHHYHNVEVHDAVVTVRREQFHGGPFRRVSNVPVHDLRPMHGAMPFSPEPGNKRPIVPSGLRPPATVLNKTVVTAGPSGARTLRPNVGARPSVVDTGRVIPGKHAVGPEVSSSKPPARFGQHVFEPATNPPAHPINPAPRTTSPSMPGQPPRAEPPSVNRSAPPETSNLENRTFSPRPHVENLPSGPVEPPIHREPAAPKVSAPPPPRSGQPGTFSAPSGPWRSGGAPRTFAPRAHVEAAAPRMAPSHSAAPGAPHGAAAPHSGGEAATGTSGGPASGHTGH